MASSETPPALKVLHIGGWGRSGSTLVGCLLGQLPGVCFVGELREVWQRGCVEDRLCGCGERFSRCHFWQRVGRAAFGSWDALDVEELLELRGTLDRGYRYPLLQAPKLAGRWRRQVDRYAEQVGRLYEGVAEVSGTRVVVDSSKLASFTLLVRHTGVDLALVHLVRDSRGVVFSWQKAVARVDATGPADAMHRYGVIGASARWTLYNAQTQALRWSGIPYLRLRYEDLVADPEARIGDLLRFAGIETDASWLATLGAEPVSLSPTHSVDGNPMRLSRSLALRADDEWRGAMSPGRRRAVTALTLPLLSRYGYPVRG